MKNYLMKILIDSKAKKSMAASSGLAMMGIISSQGFSPTVSTHRNTAKTTLAKNLVLARKAYGKTGLTQAQLAEKASVSRATIAQIESGEGDPRLSTLVDISTALETAPILLLMGTEEIRALAILAKATPQNFVSDADAEELMTAEEIRALAELMKAAPQNSVSNADTEKMRQLLSSGLSKQRLQAADLGANAMKGKNFSAIGGAIGSGWIPGIGTVIGALIATFIGFRAVKNCLTEKDNSNQISDKDKYPTC